MSRLDDLEAAAEDAGWRDEDRVTLREGLAFLRKAKMVVDSDYDLADPVSARRLIANALMLMKMFSELTERPGDDKLVLLLEKLADEPHLAYTVANSVGLAKAIIGLIKDLKKVLG